MIKINKHENATIKMPLDHLMSNWLETSTISSIWAVIIKK